MDLVLMLQNNSDHTGLQWCGLSGRQLGKLQPNSSLPLDLNLIALRQGLQVYNPHYSYHCDRGNLIEISLHLHQLSQLLHL